MEERPQITVEALQGGGDPTFEGGSLHTATAVLTNPTTSEFTYAVELYLGVLKTATSGIASIIIPAGESVNANFPIVMPIAGGEYEVYLDVSVEGVLIAHYKAIENVTIQISPAIEVGPITWI